MVDSFINPVSKEWDISKLKGAVDDQVVKAITSIPLSKVGEDDMALFQEWGLFCKKWISHG